VSISADIFLLPFQAQYAIWRTWSSNWTQKFMQFECHCY